MNPIKCKEKDCDQEMANPCQNIVALIRLHIDFNTPLLREFNPSEKNELKEQLDEARNALIESGVPFLDEEIKPYLKRSRDLETKRYFTLECAKKHRHMYPLNC